MQGINGTLAGIELAIEKGKVMQQQGDAKAMPRRTELNAVLGRIQVLEDRLHDEHDTFAAPSSQD